MASLLFAVSDPAPPVEVRRLGPTASAERLEVRSAEQGAVWRGCLVVLGDLMVISWDLVGFNGDLMGFSRI